MPDGLAGVIGELALGGSLWHGGKVCGSSAKRIAREDPFRLLPLVAATFPKGTAFGNAGKFAAATKGVPLGELASAARLRGYFPPRECFRRKQALQMPFTATTPPVKMG